MGACKRTVRTSEITPSCKLQEEARERAKQAEKDAAQCKKPLVAPKPITSLESMRQALVDMKKQCAGDDARAKLAYETLMKYVGNVYQVGFAHSSPCSRALGGRQRGHGQAAFIEAMAESAISRQSMLVWHSDINPCRQE